MSSLEDGRGAAGEELRLERFLEQELPEAPSFGEVLDAKIKLEDSSAARNLRRLIILCLLFIFIGVFAAGFVLVYLYAFDKLPKLSSDELQWILATMLGDIVAATVFTWKAASRYLFPSESDPE